ncbi:MAG: MBL fold metallo-hydrolase [Deltaproteobacteria bacterium]|nr:MBL fold metallo-hydrolase [Deltaproteobacteria bacterium]
MITTIFPVGLLACNCVILGDEDSREAIVIDPGDDAAQILATLEHLKLQVKHILHTHAHIDHVGATAALARMTGAPTYLHDADRFLHDIVPQQAALIGLPPPETQPMARTFKDGDAVRCGRLELGVIHTPGHTPGSVSLLVSGAELCLTGDTLFAGGIGRTDLWGGDFDAISRSIRDRLYTLNGAVEVVPGHGPHTTIDVERRTNDFVRG